MGGLLVKLSLIYLLLNQILVCCDRLGLRGNETDRLALLVIKAQITQDPHRVTSSWNESTHFCMWHGVTCSQRHHQRVTVLDLQSQNLVGSISPHIGNLSFLKQLHLQNNNFSHQIPPEMGHLRRLQVLRLDNNSFTGLIPHNISYCSNLAYMHFGSNKLVGTIPSEIGSLSKLQIFVVQQNNITGQIPPSLGNLSSLEVLALFDNKLFGSIPNSLGQLTRLTFFSFALNNLSGTFPASMYNLSALVTFSVSSNHQIQGSLPSDLGQTLPNLKSFRINVNQFTGSIPPSISNITGLVNFEVADNKLTGQVPNLQELDSLQTFNIQVNSLGSGKHGDTSFLSDLSNATELEWLLLNNNNFGGTLPISISNFSTKITYLMVQENRLQGSIPGGIGNLINLELLSMQGNSFTGNIPAEIGKLSSVRELDLQNNQLSGSIPSSLGNLTMLLTLQLQGNNLEGNIPPSLGKCLELLQLDLSQNNLNGTIPQQVVGLPSLAILLDLSGNQFTGSLPVDVGKLRNLGALGVSDNMLSGELPSNLGTCVSLEVLHLQGNSFKGPIPSSVISLKGLQELDLSRNNLSGEIPPFFERFGNLKKLNLSFNDFFGAVPVEGVFKNASAISIVGNTKLCGGIPTLKLPECNTKESKGGGLSRRFKLLISIVAGFALLGIPTVLYLLFLRSSRKKSKATASTTLGNPVLQVSYATLLKATDGFSSANLIGAGGFGSVYKGVLDDDRVVAVKVLNLLHQAASKSFIVECEALRNIRHRNLIKIITACSSVDFSGNDFKALVYEFMDNGSLEEWLHPTIGTEEVRDAPKNLTLLQRLDIAIDVACALDYLHNHCETPIVHCDLKPSNVLLDNELTGRVADFGLARFLLKLTSDMSANQASSIGIRGTIGYAAPEYGMGSEVATNGDVYSFGILLLEMFTGKRPTDNMFSDSLNLHKFVNMAFPQRVIEIADSLLVQGGNVSTSTSNTPNQSSSSSSIRDQKLKECLSLIFGIGIACSAESPRDRKGISDVVSQLNSIRDTLLA